jgi:hypothetical protein
MFTNFYCVVQSAAWIDKVSVPQFWDGYCTGSKVHDVVHRSAAFDILSRGADKSGIVVDRSEGNAHYFRPLVGDVIRPSYLQVQVGADGADIEVEVYRWTGDEATTTKFKPVADMYLSFNYPRRGDGQGLGFGTDDKLLPLKDAFPEFRPGPQYGPTTAELIGNVTEGKVPELDFAISSMLKRKERRRR